jgi:hypothetical protein
MAPLGRWALPYVAALGLSLLLDPRYQSIPSTAAQLDPLALPTAAICVIVQARRDRIQIERKVIDASSQLLDVRRRKLALQLTAGNRLPDEFL